jgi:hypothetical protein
MRALASTNGRSPVNDGEIRAALARIEASLDKLLRRRDRKPNAAMPSDLRLTDEHRLVFDAVKR